MSATPDGTLRSHQRMAPPASTEPPNEFARTIRLRIANDLLTVRIELVLLLVGFLRALPAILAIATAAFPRLSILRGLQRVPIIFDHHIRRGGPSHSRIGNVDTRKAKARAKGKPRSGSTAPTPRGIACGSVARSPLPRSEGSVPLHQWPPHRQAIAILRSRLSQRPCVPSIDDDA